ncbi:hypothetical protein C1H46_008949 [Malus baccata]|uniref:Uncharacterized protein n=1 Tax=Malus baccata TaxID=106549 RepID=A0A540N312_MALBA|nr:hypothetical protein C1H46_008949 [Malus baccata]
MSGGICMSIMANQASKLKKKDAYLANLSQEKSTPKWTGLGDRKAESSMSGLGSGPRGIVFL